ncbi:MAG: mechanosensitive ion channel [Coriobacteriia bacterium]|nr:mechanosensitive ion channel [Coriobacteriia bacterium]
MNPTTLIDRATDVWEKDMVAFLGNDIVARIVMALIIALITVWVTHFAIKAVNKALRKNDSPLADVSIFDKVIRVALYFVGFCIILDACLDVNITAFIAALGIGGLALSLGAQDTMKNLIGGATIVMCRLYRPGDNITIGGQTGVVRDIGWRQTAIINRTGEVVFVPNSNASTSTIVVTAPLEKSQVSFIVANDRDLNELANEIAVAAGSAVASLAKVEKAPIVQFSEITADGARGKVIVWNNRGDLALEIADAITRAINPIVR